MISCREGKKLIIYSVSEIASKEIRAIEEMGTFYVNGIVNGKINMGFIKVFIFIDKKNANQSIYIISDHTSLPSNKQESTVKVKLYKEIAFNEVEFLIFEEVTD